MLADVLNHLTPDIPKAAYALLGVLVGHLVTHRLSLARDRRKDFNALAVEAFASLKSEVRALQAGQVPMGSTIIRSHLLELHMSRGRARRFNAALTRYNAARKAAEGNYQPGGLVTRDPKDVHELLLATEDLARYLLPR